MNLGRLFDRSMARYAARPALAAGTQDPLSYAALGVRVQRLAHWLRAQMGLADGDRVALVMGNGADYAECLLAIWYAGLCAVPINAKLHAKELQFVLRDSGSRVCLSRGTWLEAASMYESPACRFIDTSSAAYEALQAGQAMPGAASAANDAGAWLFYTSGTTGRPKGALLSHANLVNMALNFHFDLQAVTDSDVLLHAAPMSHGSGMYGIPYWMRGGLQVVPESGGFDEAELCALVSHWGSVSFFAAPTMLNRLVGHCRATRQVLPKLRTIFAGGAPLYVEDIKAAVDCLGGRIAQMYGQGETPMTISTHTASEIAAAVAAGDTEALASVGYPQTSVGITLLDPSGAPVTTPGECGEIAVASPTVMQRYWNAPEATAAALRDGLLMTGDLGAFDATGRLHLLGRSKELIISGGSNIYPREIEEVLLMHPGVAEAAVIGVPDADWGESVVAFIVARSGCDVDAAALDRFCLDHIARFKRPKRYVTLAQLPKNATGKVLKNELAGLVDESVARRS